MKLLPLTVVLFSACAPKVDMSMEKSQVKQVVDQFEQVWETKNIDLFSQIMAHDSDMVCVGTDLPEYFVGWEPLKGAVGEMFPVMDSIQLDVKNQVVKVHPSGQVAWFSEIVDWNLKVQGQPYVQIGNRFTGVLEKRNGKWVIVQFHNSVPVKPA